SFKSVFTVGGVPWTGCAVLFLQSLCPGVNLLSLYKDNKTKFIVFKVIKLTLSDSAGGLEGYEILKCHDADPFLGVEIKFLDVSTCQQFLESYSSGTMRQSLSQHGCRLLTLPQEISVQTQLKASTHTLDPYLDQMELCLQQIHLSKPERLRDEEIERLEKELLDQTFNHAQTPTQEESVPINAFKFQNRVFKDRMLTQADVQSFSSGVGRQWKFVGRALGKNCRALKGPAIDNLGREAKLSRLVKALEDCKLMSLAENILDFQP
uniref:TRADD N-terminal domain-containing protein n=1 Tax=Periophthalmus magnuspinnatus TaxID=409849 RepID=A0A3B3ZEK0_9GOBI